MLLATGVVPWDWQMTSINRNNTVRLSHWVRELSRDVA